MFVDMIFRRQAVCGLLVATMFPKIELECSYIYVSVDSFRKWLLASSWKDSSSCEPMRYCLTSVAKPQLHDGTIKCNYKSKCGSPG